MKEQDIIVSLTKSIFHLILIVVVVLVVGLVTIMWSPASQEIVITEFKEVKSTSGSPVQQIDFFNQDFDLSSLNNSPLDSSIRHGYQLIINTNTLIGPLASDVTKQYTGNMLTCNNCHLNAGTKPFAAPYIGVTGKFPQYRGRENVVGSIEERINGCMERSMNGKKLPENGYEMRSMVAYMNWLSKKVPVGNSIQGQGFKPIEVPARAVDLENGEKVFTNSCASCHGPKGLGIKNEDGTYAFPPLGGNDSYNHGAGMHRVLTASQFIKYNMPLGATVDSPILSDSDAFDVAGYINSFSRPRKTNTDKDYPDLKRKPVSTPYGPWEDSFTAQQHKYGPFPEIIAYYSKTYALKKTK